MINATEAIKDRKEQDFKADLMMAQRTEQALAKWIDSQGIYKKVKIANKKGYDLECVTKEDALRKIEIKRDFWVDKYKNDAKFRKATNNICVELWSNFDCGNPGWIHYSDSHYIFYIGNENIYILNTQRLKYITNRIVEHGVAARVEPCLKDGVPSSIAKVQYTAHYNGNFKVRSVLINKDWLIKQKCIVNVLHRESSGFDLIAKDYSI